MSTFPVAAGVFGPAVRGKLFADKDVAANSVTIEIATNSFPFIYRLFPLVLKMSCVAIEPAPKNSTLLTTMGRKTYREGGKKEARGHLYGPRAFRSHTRHKLHATRNP